MSALRDYFGFESRSQLAAFITALASSEIPGKYAYVGESAKAYNAHALTKEYSQVTRSTASESALLPAVWGEDLAEIRTLVDVGPGNGLHSVGVLQQVAAATNWLPGGYLGVDYSSHMAALALDNVQRAFPGFQVSSVQFDIESTFAPGPSPLSNVAESLYFLLGNTIGNVESMARAIRGIRSLAGRGARLLIGCALLEERHGPEKFLQPYRMKTYLDCVLRPLVMIGVPRRSLEFDLAFDPEARVISSLARFNAGFRADILDK